MRLRWCGIVFVVFSVEAVAEKCFTPNNEEGECISLYSCSHLLDRLATKQNASIEFVRKSNCGCSISDHWVCCGPPSSALIVDRSDSSPKGGSDTTNKLIPDKRYCGLQHADDYFHSGNATGIDEFPWLAALMYQGENSTLEAKCGGSLISNRYILTLADCLTNASKHNLVAVRLGEYNIKTQADCIDSAQFGEECTDPPQDYGIETEIPHPMYKRGPGGSNIALIRLNRKVTYTDYIRPICLPVPGTERVGVGDFVVTTGWGRKKDSQEQTEIKKKIFSKLISNQECKAVNDLYRQFVTENHFCTAIPRNGTEIICRGDRGGPTMVAVKNQWYQEGITEFGSTTCEEQYPDGHSKVANYVAWIVENIKP